ncbi:MAG: hypothetical protein N2257_01975 [Thermodesulfovibrionales bacterium]|nr:hypothetical protein [Thermodesulfovibrionales bacterium]
MEKYLFMKTLADMLEREDFLKKVFSIYLKAVAVFALLAGLVGFVIGWREVFKMQTSGIIGGTIFQLLFAVAVYAGVHALLIGSQKIRDLKAYDSLYTNIGHEIIKTFANAYSAFAIIMAIAGGIFIWFAGPGVINANPLFKTVTYYYPFSGLKGETFIQGLTFMVRGIAYTFLIFLGLQIIAELLKAFTGSSKGR